eukprot:1186598-Prorocentrum_minimum.AAC.2
MVVLVRASLIGVPALLDWQYGPPEWRKHRSVNRYTRHLGSMLTSSIVKGLLPPVGACTLSALLVCLGNEFGGDYLTGPLALPMDPFTLSAPALSLLLVFRTNASYGRWWEARKVRNSIRLLRQCDLG